MSIYFYFFIDPITINIGASCDKIEINEESTEVKLFMPDDLFFNFDIKYCSIILSQDAEIKNSLDNAIRNVASSWPLIHKRKWADTVPHSIIFEYQTTPDKWMPFNS